MPSAAHAQSAPDKGIFEAQYLNYRDWQPGRNRMTVWAPAFYALVPLSDTWVVEGGMVYDSMSGASPLYFNVLSGASIGDYRTAGDVKVTKYVGNTAVSVGGFVLVGAGLPVTRRLAQRAVLQRGSQPHVAPRRGWQQRPHQRNQRRGARTRSATRSSSWSASRRRSRPTTSSSRT
jgi:hypothetical protein